MGNWREAAEKRAIGDKHDLTNLPGYWFVPRRYSTEAKDRLRAIASRAGDGISDELLEIVQQKQESGEELTQAENLRMARETTSDGMYLENAKIMLRYGIHRHSFEDEDGTTPSITEEWVDEFLTLVPADVVDEMVTVIREANRPLAEKNEERSQTSPSGSTRGPQATSSAA